MQYQDLKPSENNYNFSFDILEKIFLDKLKIPFTVQNFFFVLSGAKGFGKTFLICLLALFFTSNFDDWNCLLSKYTYVASKASYPKTIAKVLSLLEEYGVTLKQAIDEKEIKVFNSDSKCEYVFPNKRVIKIIGFDNTSKWEGVPAEVGEWAMFAIDEVIPVKEQIVDLDVYMYQLLNMVVQIYRGKSLATSNEIFSELSSNGWYLKKKLLCIFGFNNHDTSHPIYQFFVNSISPLTPEIKNELEHDAVSFRENKTFLNVGATVIRGTTKINENNLSDELLVLGEGIKENFPEVYDSLFLGGEHEMSIDKYSYRKDLLMNAKFFNPNDFYWKDISKFWFDEIRIGCDYADGGDFGDDAVTILIGFEMENEYVKGIYILEENSISTRMYKDMTLKVGDIASTINDWSKKYVHTNEKIILSDSIKFRIGHDSRTIKDFIKKILLDNYKWDQEILDYGFSLFLATGSKGWGIDDRHYTWKRLLSEGKIYFSKDLKVSKNINGTDVILKEFGHLYDALYKCINHPDKNIRDERPKKNNLDPINAAEHALSYFRFLLFEN